MAPKVLLAWQWPGALPHSRIHQPLVKQDSKSWSSITRSPSLRPVRSSAAGSTLQVALPFEIHNQTHSRLLYLQVEPLLISAGATCFEASSGFYSLKQIPPALTKSSFPKITRLLQEAFWSSKEAVAPKEICQVFQVSLAVEEVNQVLLEEVKDFSVVATCIKLDTSGHTKLGP